MNILGNIINGQVSEETAKQLFERFGKIMQDMESLSINSSDTSVSLSQQFEMAIPLPPHRPFPLANLWVWLP